MVAEETESGRAAGIDPSAEVPGGRLLSVGDAAGRLGVATATVRSWERRYGLAPGGRSPGGHRRYTEDDLARLLLMQRLIGGGHTPATAARAVLGELDGPAALAGSDLVRPDLDGPDLDRPGLDKRGLDGLGLEGPGLDRSAAGQPAVAASAGTGYGAGRRRSGPGGRVLAVPGSSAEVRGLARAASRLDADAAAGQLGDLLVSRGAVQTWNQVLRPVLVAAGLRWLRTGESVDVEHVLSEASIEAMRAYRAFLPRPASGRPVLLACAPADQHTLPLHVLAAALAERRVPVRLMGGRVPVAALATAARRTGASAIFVWRQLVELNAQFADEDGETDAQFPALPPSRPALRLVVGGPGWPDGHPPPGAQLAPDLQVAVGLLMKSAR
jgi:hypothetical protein